MAALGVTYHYEQQPLIDAAKDANGWCVYGCVQACVRVCKRERERERERGREGGREREGERERCAALRFGFMGATSLHPELTPREF